MIASAARDSESKPDSRASLLDDVPFSITQNLKLKATVAVPESPHGYVGNGECPIKRKCKNRPDFSDHTSWRNI